MIKLEKNFKIKYNIIDILIYCFNISLKSSKLYTILRIICKIILSILPLLTACLNRKLINIITNHSTNSSTNFLIIIIIAYTSAIISNLIINNLNIYIMNIHTSLIQNFMNLKISEKAITLDISSFDNPEFYNKLSNAQVSIQSVIVIIWNVTDIFGSIISCISAFVVLATFDIRIGILLVTISLPNAIFTHLYTKKLFNLEKENITKQRESQYYYNLMTSRQSCQDVRFWNVGNLFLDKYNTIWNKWFLARKKLLKKRNIVQTITNIIPFIFICFFLIIIGISIYKGERTPGDFILYSNQLELLNSSILSLILSFAGVYDNRLRISNIIELENIKICIKNGNKLLKDTVECIEFRNVSFTYPFGKRKVLNEVNFKINRGDKVALVGILYTICIRLYIN